MRRTECEARLAGTKAALEEAALLQRSAESAARDQEALLQKLEGQQHQVKTNEAYTALLHEMEQARQAISDAETQILEAMETIETARASAGGAQSEVDAMLARIAEEETEIDAREVELDAQIATLESQRNQVCADLEASLLARYDKVASRRRPAIAIVAKEICMGCRVGIPPQVSIELMRGEKLFACGNCQRILIRDDQLGSEAG